MYSETTATRKIASLTKKIRAVQGGTSASKTISILLYLITRAQMDKVATITSIVSESIPHLKKGAMRDFKRIMKSHNIWDESSWSSTDSTYTFKYNGSQIEFFGAEQADKLRGGRRDRGFMNECNNLTMEAFDEFEVRTREFVFLDWNPTVEFWFYTDVLNVRTDVEHIILTYKDNEACPPEIVASIEQRKARKGWWRVYGLGLLGEVEGRIYKTWNVVYEIPHEARLIRRCLDFGYSMDPTAIVDIYEYNGGYILDELLYKKGMKNTPIAEFILNQSEQCLVIADSSEPKSIDEIKDYNIAIVGVEKGPESIRNGIGLVQEVEERLSVTRRSANILSEQRKYLWRYDRNGQIISPNTPEDGDDHCLDAIRYGFMSLKRPKVNTVHVHKPKIVRRY